MVEVKTDVKTEEVVDQKEEVVPPVAETVPADDGLSDIKRSKILAQVEYYFGDVNLPKDNFIKSEMSQNDGWFSLKSLLKFNRLKGHLTDIKEELQEQALVNVLRESELIDVNEAGDKIRRSLEHPLPDSDLDERTVYLKNFDKTETTLDELLDYFKSTYEGVEAVIMRYFNRKVIENTGDVPKVGTKREFKGSIFLVFKDNEKANAFLNSGEKVYKGATLIKMMQKEYKGKKMADYLARVETRKKAQKREAEGDGDKEGEDGDDENEKEEAKPSIPPNVFVKILALPEGFSREDIKAKWNEFLGDDKDQFKIAYIDFNRGEKDAVLRLERENSATEALAKCTDGKFPVGEEKTCEVVALTAEEEAEQRTKFSERQNSFKRGGGGHRGKRGKRGGGYGGGGRGGKRGRRN